MHVNAIIKIISKIKYLQSFFPEEKFLNNILIVQCEKGMNKKFQDNNVFINLADFFEHKVQMKNYYDIIIAMKSSNGKGNEIIFASYCNIVGDKELLGKAGASIQLKISSQELNVQ